MEKNTLSMLQLSKTQVRSCFSSSLSPTHFPNSLRVLLATPLWFISLLSSSNRLQRKCTQPPPWRCGLQDFTSHVHLPASLRWLLATSQSCDLTLQNVGEGQAPAQPSHRRASSPCKEERRVVQSFQQHWLLSSCERSLQC